MFANHEKIGRLPVEQMSISPLSGDRGKFRKLLRAANIYFIIINWLRRQERFELNLPILSSARYKFIRSRDDFLIQKLNNFRDSNNAKE